MPQAHQTKNIKIRGRERESRQNQNPQSKSRHSSPKPNPPKPRTPYPPKPQDQMPQAHQTKNIKIRGREGGSRQNQNPPETQPSIKIPTFISQTKLTETQNPISPQNLKIECHKLIKQKLHFAINTPLLLFKHNSTTSRPPNRK
jgi:hypothetical protein